MNKHKYNAFTLVELIVVITILAILGTIAFISLQSYSTQARDSTRVSDLGSIKSSLELYQLDAGKYPNPTLGIDITYSGGVVWIQGSFGESSFKNIDKLDKIPKDPLTEKEYTYSITNNKNEYQLGGILEGGEITQKLNNPYNLNGFNTKVQAGEILTSAYTIGNYNGQITKTITGTTCYILATPTIITADTSITDLEQIVSNNNFVYNGYKNLPSTFEGSKFKQDGGFEFTPNNLVAYTDNNSCEPIIDKTNNNARIKLIKGIQDAYTSTILKDEGEIKNLVAMEINTSSPSEEVISFAANIVNNELGGSLDVSTNNYSTNNVDFETESGYSVIEGTFTRTSTEKSEGIYSIESGNHLEGSTSCFEVNHTSLTAFDVTFDYKVSTSSTWDDSLVFWSNGDYIDGYIGEVDWTSATHSFLPGDYSFQWCYDKSGAAMIGQDKAWVDDIRFSDADTYEVSGSFGASGSGAYVYACGVITHADSSGNFTVNALKHSNCSDTSADSFYYICNTSTNGPADLQNDVSNISGNCIARTPFITTWKTDNPGDSDSRTIRLPMYTYEYASFDVDWGDGNTERVNISDLPEMYAFTSIKEHSYDSAGTYTVSILGKFPYFHNLSNGDSQKLMTVSQWGNTIWKSMRYGYSSSTNLTITATDSPNLSSVTDLSYMFLGASSINQDIGFWDVSNITDMSNMFQNATSFNQDLTSWDVGSVINHTDFRTGTSAWISGWPTGW